MAFREIEPQKALTFIEPGPVVLVTTFDGKKHNVMTLTWTCPVNFDNDFILATGPWNHSFRALTETKECVVCIPPPSLLRGAVLAGTVSGKDADKFSSLGFTAVGAETVKACLIAECSACLECTVTDYLPEYSLLVIHCNRVVVNDDVDARICHAVGDGTFFADGEKFVYRDEMKDKLPPGL